jgi:hypothetical protein
MKTYWVLADYTMFGTFRNPPILQRAFTSRWRPIAFLQAWWFAMGHISAHPHGKAFILDAPPPPIGNARALAD